MRAALVLCLTMMAAGGARAQDAAAPQLQTEPETIYSQAQREKDDSTARHFVQEYLAPQQGLDDTFSRWKRPVCPKVWGLTPLAAWQVEHRIKELANEVSAPVNRDDPCSPNVLVVFSENPQAALDAIADEHWELVVQRSHRLTMKYPIQTWYETGIRGCNGQLWLDIGDGPSPGVACGSRLFTGLTAEMVMATIIIDSKSVIGLSLRTVADYVAVTTLSQTVQRGTCQPTQSVTNLLVKDCNPGEKSDGASDVDLAMLSALYHAPERPEILQKILIVRAMKEALAKQRGAAP